MYKMTSARRAALRKAQLASARKRKKTGKNKRSNISRRQIVLATGGLFGAAALVAGGYYGKKSYKTHLRKTYFKSAGPELRKMARANINHRAKTRRYQAFADAYGRMVREQNRKPRFVKSERVYSTPKPQLALPRGRS